MSALYDSGLYDADDVIKAYTDGYQDAAQRMTLFVRLCCPHCSTCLSTRKHLLEHRLMLFLHPTYCPYCEIQVIPGVSFGKA